MEQKSHQFSCVEDILDSSIPDEKIQIVNKILHGDNLEEVVVDTILSQRCNSQVKAYKIDAAPEQMRRPRKVSIGIIQNKTQLPTTSPIETQLRANHEKIGTILDAAGSLGVNIVCMQEAWTMHFALVNVFRGQNLLSQPRMGQQQDF